MSQPAVASNTVKRIAHLDMPGGGNGSPQSNDVEVGGRGLINLRDRNNGIDILEFER